MEKDLQEKLDNSNEELHISDVSDSNIPRDIQSEYNTLISRLRDGSTDPDINEVEDRIDELRELYPNIKVKY